LRQLSPRLKELHPLPYSSEEQRRLAAQVADKLSIGGVQPKLSAVLSPSAHSFEIVERNGRYILKPPHPHFSEVPENEALTMDLARRAGVEVPPFGLVPNSDGTFTYFVKRFDRHGKKGKYSVEDFAQLSAASRNTKYRSSLEQVVAVIETHCTFPLVEKVKLWRRVLVAFLSGNEDMHLKNYSLITAQGKTELTPAYDLVNTTIILAKAKEESALPLRGKKSRLKRDDLVDYLAAQRLSLRPQVIERVLGEVGESLPFWHERIARAHLSEPKKSAYLTLLNERASRLDLSP
jgi:serine/threonine-protein kinase HipA